MIAVDGDAGARHVADLGNQLVYELVALGAAEGYISVPGQVQETALDRRQAQAVGFQALANRQIILIIRSRLAQRLGGSGYVSGAGAPVQHDVAHAELNGQLQDFFGGFPDRPGRAHL